MGVRASGGLPDAMPRKRKAATDEVRPFAEKERLIAAIDPGLLFCGLALFSGDGTLLAAELVDGYASTHKSVEWIEMGRAVARRLAVQVDELVIERPKIYGSFSKFKGDQNDLLDIAAVVGAICAKVNAVNVVTFLPSDWKGQQPKEVTQRRVKLTLSDAEWAKVKLPQKSLEHNVYDAIGIGLAHLQKRGIRQSWQPLWTPPIRGASKKT